MTHVRTGNSDVRSLRLSAVNPYLPRMSQAICCVVCLSCSVTEHFFSRIFTTQLLMYITAWQSVNDVIQVIVSIHPAAPGGHYQCALFLSQPIVSY